MAGLCGGDSGPQELRHPVATLGSLLDGEIHQQGEMLPGAKPDWLTGGGKEGGLTQATEIPLRLHRVSLVVGYAEYAGRTTNRQQLASRCLGGVEVL
jgi:hypothetical protein